MWLQLALLVFPMHQQESVFLRGVSKRCEQGCIPAQAQSKTALAMGLENMPHSKHEYLQCSRIPFLKMSRMPHHREPSVGTSSDRTLMFLNFAPMPRG